MSGNPELAMDVRATICSELESGALDVPLLPQVASDVLASTLDDQANAQHLAALIEKDQGLASHIMRVVNSPGFRGSSEIVSLKQATARLGMERIREIALTISLKGTIFKPGPYDELVQTSWEFGLETALWAKEIARVARKNVEIAYLCGLLHNVGEPILVNRCAQLDAGAEQAQVEAIVADLSSKAGILLVGQWHLPGVVAVCIDGLREEAEAPELASELDAVRVVEASRLVTRRHREAQLENDQNTDADLDPSSLVEDEAFQYLNFYPDDAVEVLAKTEQVTMMMAGMQ